MYKWALSLFGSNVQAMQSLPGNATQAIPCPTTYPCSYAQELAQVPRKLSCIEYRRAHHPVSVFGGAPSGGLCLAEGSVREELILIQDWADPSETVTSVKPNVLVHSKNESSRLGWGSSFASWWPRENSAMGVMSLLNGSIEWDTVIRRMSSNSRLGKSR